MTTLTPSKQILLENPVAIKVINDHVASGVYAQVQSIVEKERMLGRLEGLSDLEAYKQVGDVLAAQGGVQQSSPGTFTPSSTNKSKANKKSADSKLRSRKKLLVSLNPLLVKNQTMTLIL